MFALPPEVLLWLLDAPKKFFRKARKFLRRSLEWHKDTPKWEFPPTFMDTDSLFDITKNPNINDWLIKSYFSFSQFTNTYDFGRAVMAVNVAEFGKIALVPRKID